MPSGIQRITYVTPSTNNKHTRQEIYRQCDTATTEQNQMYSSARRNKDWKCVTEIERESKRESRRIASFAFHTFVQIEQPRVN